jgi:dihydrofolate synthase / folylpolyglutamate synthase
VSATGPTAHDTLDTWLVHIGRQHVAEIVMGLDRVREVWLRMAASGTSETKHGPQAPVNIVVGGTNGKGSTCAMLESVLTAAGFKTGFNSSPHLVRYNERVRIGKRMASDAMLVDSFVAVEAARLMSPPVSLTYFEYATLSALWVFAQEKVDVAILEVGLGGRLDAVNIIDADVSVVVSIDLDHQNYLGDTIEKIALEKAHIYRPDRCAIFADTSAPASLVMYANEIGAKLVCLGSEYRFQRKDGQWDFVGTILDHKVNRYSLPMPALRGSYQLKNAAGAIAALAALHERLPVSLGHLKRGLLEVEWPGRMQVLPGRPAVVLDVAHNPHAARALEDALGTMGFYENTYAVFGMLKDKDIDEVIRTVKGRIDHWFVASLTGERGSAASDIGTRLDKLGLANARTLHVNVASAYAAARERAGQNDRILIFGSFQTVADAMRVIKPLGEWAEG